MTNEDKAFAFANKNFEAYSHDEDPLDALRDGFLYGAEWKDHQFKEYLEKKSQELIFSDNWADGLKLQFLTEIINELFPKEETEDYTERED